MIHQLLIKQSLYSTYSAINKNGEGVTNGDIAPAGTCLLCLDLRVREAHLSNPTTPFLSNNTRSISNNTSHNTILGHPGFSLDYPGPQSTKKVPHRNGFGTIEDLSGLTQNGEGVCRFHALTHLSEPTRTYFPKSSANTPPHTPPQDCGRPRTLANDPEQPISRRKSV